MPGSHQDQRGWAFLVARGRRRGYRSILVPDFLAETDEYGALTENVHGDVDPSAAPRVQQITLPAAGPLVLAYRSRRVTRADVDPAPTPAEAADLVTDAHGRPLDLLYGFVCRASAIPRPSEADLHSTALEALRAYRAFLADETAFTVRTSHAFPLRTPVPAQNSGPPGDRARAPQARRWAPAVAAVAAVAIVAGIIGTAAARRPRPGIELPPTATCALDQRTHRCTIPVPVRATGGGTLTLAGASLATPTPAAAEASWSVDDAACRPVATAASCTLVVTVTGPPPPDGSEFTATLTVTLRQPTRTGTVRLTATGSPAVAGYSGRASK